MKSVRFLSEELKDAKFEPGRLNLIVSGTGTGKSEFVRRGLLKAIDGLKPIEILYVTSRSMTRDQQAKKDNIEAITYEDINVVNYWNGKDEDLDAIRSDGIWIMNYSQFIRYLDTCKLDQVDQMSNVRVAVFDECHAMYSDRFIRDIGMVRMWVKQQIKEKRIILIGMTATPGIVESDMLKMHYKAKRVNREYIINYKAKSLTVILEKDLIQYLKRRSNDKTLIMCSTYDGCEEIQKRIPYSEIICSQSNGSYTDRMRILRDYVLEHECFPPDTSIFSRRGVHPINCVITTSTMREGVNLRKESGIKRVVTFIPDELHVKQFVGRCRFDVDELIVVYGGVHSNAEDSYIINSRRAFTRYIRDQNDTEWFNSIKDIVDVEFHEVNRVNLNMECEEFNEYINEKWLVEDIEDEDQTVPRRIFCDGKQEILSKAKQHLIFGAEQNKYTFKAVFDYIENTLGYKIVASREFVDGKRKHYRIIYKEKENYEAGNDE